jgi:DnaJ-domain-containing protein 1
VLTNKTLARINTRPRQVSRLPLLAVGGGTLVLTVLAALAYVFGMLPPFAILALLGGGALLILVLYMTQKAKMIVSLSYKGNLDDEVASRFSEVREVLEGLASSEGIWRLPDSAKSPKAGEVAPFPETREPARVGLLPTPGIKADVQIWGIEAGDGTIFFFPEGTLLYRNDRYEPISYKVLKMTLSSGRFFEEGDLPDDATVVESIWRFSRPDGSPDPRYKTDNFEIPVVLYSLLYLNGPLGLEMRLMVSNRRAAARFARAFGAEDLREKRHKNSSAGAATASGKASGRSSSNGQKGREEAYRSAEDLEREARLATARKTLGVAKGAKAEEIIAAYRELARTHHPDKVASLAPEASEYSEQRMKEINAAYAVLKRQWSEPATEETGAG